jgi:hypothetical protein
MEALVDTKVIDKIKTLLRNAANIGGFFDYFAEVCREPRCDKHGNGFNQDRRFSAFHVDVSFDSWRGYFGNSGCGTVLSVDPKIAEEYFVKALNEHKPAIFATMAAMMRADARKLQADAQKEISALQEMITNLDPPVGDNPTKDVGG